MGSWEKWGCEQVVESRSTRRKEWGKENMKKGRTAPVL
jgi:hypothetical protein